VRLLGWAMGMRNGVGRWDRGSVGRGRGGGFATTSIHHLGSATTNGAAASLPPCLPVVDGAGPYLLLGRHYLSM
jgi:hypothetical protein